MNEFSEDSVIEKLCQQAQHLEISTINPNYVEIEDYQKERHWNKMNLACELISKECTKMAVAFSKPPLPNAADRKSLVNDIAEAADILIAWYNTFPMKEGKTLHKVLSQCVQSILHSTSDFISSHHQQEQPNSKSKKKNLVSTGNVWECCKKFKSLPKDNIIAVVNEIDSYCKLLSDAINEVNESLQEEEKEEEEQQEAKGNEDSKDYDFMHEDSKWTEDERKLVKPCLCLFMASKGLLKKTRTMLQSLKLNQNTIDLADQSIELYRNISSSVDDMVMHLYPPVDRMVLANHFQALTKELQDILLYLSSAAPFATDENNTWINIHNKALKHYLGNFNLFVNVPKTN